MVDRSRQPPRASVENLTLTLFYLFYCGHWTSLDSRWCLPAGAVLFEKISLLLCELRSDLFTVTTCFFERVVSVAHFPRGHGTTSTHRIHTSIYLSLLLTTASLPRTRPNLVLMSSVFLLPREKQPCLYRGPKRKLTPVLAYNFLPY